MWRDIIQIRCSIPCPPSNAHVHLSANKLKEDCQAVFFLFYVLLWATTTNSVLEFTDAFADVHVWQDVISLIHYSQKTGGEGGMMLWLWINKGASPFFIKNVSEVSIALES